MSTPPQFPILAVDDDAVDLMLIRRALKRVGLTNPLYEVHHGEEALRFLRREEPFGEDGIAPTPGLVLLDLNMPIMSGLELLEVAKADPELKTIPIVVLTTSDAERDVVESYRRGAAGYIVKPVDFAQFADAVRSIGEYWRLCLRRV